MGKRKRSSSKKKDKSSKRRKLDNINDEPVDDAYTASLFENGKFSYHSLKLKNDHKTKPLWVCPNKTIFLETFSPLYTQAYDFLIAIAEPISRLRIMHEYKLTEFSLCAAVSVGLSVDSIINVLDRLSKVYIPSEIMEYIRVTTESFGKVSLVLRQNRYFLEAISPQILLTLQKDSIIKKSQIISDDCDPDTGFIKSTTSRVTVGIGATENSYADDDVHKDMDDGGGFIPQEYYCIEVSRDNIDDIKNNVDSSIHLGFEEYDFANDTENENLRIDLKPSTALRPYQEKSLSKMFGNGRARSGIIVLPCGAGKTLVGVTAACTVKKRTLVLTTNSVSVEQWKAQFLQWSTIADKHITCFTTQSTVDSITEDTKIIVTTYSMLSHQGKRSSAAIVMLNKIKEKEWGMLILDEVHVVPADTFRQVVNICAAHCKLGLTATLVREDDKIKDLNFLIGPKLYEANWLDLSREGYIATVSCAEVWCDMTAEFFKEWLTTPNVTRRKNKQRQLSIMNPNKFRICEFLIKYHEARNDKILVFSDDLFALEHYAKTLGKVYLYGSTSIHERNAVLSEFKYTNRFNTIFISKIGDNAIDLPEANVLIQISSHYGARRQEAQRLGRILRAKAKTKSEYNAYFYTLISKYTEEMAYSLKRQRFLINQGYSYRIITEIPEMEKEKLHYETKEEQIALLSAVKVASCSKEKSNVHDKIDSRRKQGRSSALSGGTGRSYSSKSIFDTSARPSLLPKRK